MYHYDLYHLPNILFSFCIRKVIMMVVSAGDNSRTAKGHEEGDQYGAVCIKLIIKTILSMQCRLGHLI